METLLVGALLIVAGLLISLAGYGLFRIILPIMGFFTGFSLGFAAVQGLFGANVWSYLTALLTALFFGAVLAALSYFYYTAAVMIISASLFAGAFGYLGQAVGLSEDGFLVLMLSLTGAVIGGIAVLRYGIQHGFMIYLTAMYGVGLLLISAYLLVGDLTVGDLHETGITKTISDTISSSWLWLIVWLGGTIIAASIQTILIGRAIYSDRFMIEE